MVEKEHCLALWELEDLINESDAGTASLTAWRAEIESWEKDCSQCNPFQSRVKGKFFFVATNDTLLTNLQQ
jgi:hypothetical protein